MSETHDVIIVGAGPAGLAAGIYTGRSRIETLILEKGIPGGQILLTDIIENYPGFPEGVSPQILMDKIRAQAERFGARIATDDVKALRRAEDAWEVLGTKETYSAKAVIVATGSTHRKLGVEGE
ncbi:MAG: FAD-dependent oxidoreductase, partial [Candidatus Aminicenantales bacterium]